MVLNPFIPLTSCSNKFVLVPKHVRAPEKGGPQERWTRTTWQWPWHPGSACWNAFKKVRVVRRKGRSDSATETRLCFVPIERTLWEDWAWWVQHTSKSTISRSRLDNRKSWNILEAHWTIKDFVLMLFTRRPFSLCLVIPYRSQIQMGLGAGTTC